MKKKVVLIAIACFLVGNLFGCGSTNTNTVSSSAEPTTAAETAKVSETESVGMASPGGKDEIMMGTATTGGFTYLWGAACAEILNKYVDGVNVTAQITTGGSENMVRIVNNEMPMGIAGSNVVAQFYDGDADEGITENKNLRTLWVSKATTFSVIVPRDSSYQTLEDLKGKKVSIGNQGGSAAESIYACLEVFGMADNYFDLQYLTMNESKDAMVTGTIDGFITNTSDPHTAMTELFMTGNFRFLDMPQDKVDLITSSIPYMKPSVRAAGTYEKQDKDVIGWGSPYALVVREDFPEETAYQIAKALDEHYDEWIAIASNVEGSTLDAAIANAYAPLHPGVERYAKEKGLIK